MSRHRTIAEQAVAQLLSAYRKGFFPMADVRTGDVRWFNPETRGVMPVTAPAPEVSPEDAPLSEAVFHVPRTLRQRVRSGRFTITSDRAFAATIVGCADPSREGAWIDETIIRTYRLLHDAGHAHSIEAWLPDTDGPIDADAAADAPIDIGRERAGAAGPPLRLVGGLYGVSIGSAFFGESMFSRDDWGGRDASKVCLVHLVAHLRRRGYTLLDTQMWSWHLEQFGCREVPRATFLPLLEKACRKRSVTWGEFEALATDADEEPDAASAGDSGARAIQESEARASRVQKRLPGSQGEGNSETRP